MFNIEVPVVKECLTNFVFLKTKLLMGINLIKDIKTISV